MDKYLLDILQVVVRRLLKKAGISASYDVGVFEDVTKDFRSQIETVLKITAPLTPTHLEAL